MTTPLNLAEYTYCLPANSLPEQCEKHECSICLDSLKEHERVTQVACQHLFHTQCLNKWLESRQTCPNCRGRIQRYPRNNLPWGGDFVPRLLSGNNPQPPPPAPLHEIIKKKYERLPHIFSSLSATDRRQSFEKIQKALLQRDLNPIVLQRPANAEKFQDYLQAVKSLESEALRSNFIQQLAPHEQMEILFLFCVSSLSTDESKALIQNFLKDYRQAHATDYATSLIQRYKTHWPDIKQEGESVDFTLIRALFNPNDDRSLLLTLESPLMQEAFLDFVEASKRLASPQALKRFFQRQSLSQRFFVLLLMRNSIHATAESRQLTDSYFAEQLPEYLHQLKQYLRTKYTQSSFFQGLEKQQEHRLFAQLKAIILDQDPFYLPTEGCKEKFMDFLEFLKRCPSESERHGFLKALDQRHLLEILYLLRHSPYKNEQSLALTQKIVDELSKGPHALHFAQKVLYKHRYNWKGLIHGLYVNNDKAYLMRLKNKVLENVGQPPLNFSSMKEKFDDFFSALKKLQDPLIIMKFLDSLTELERYEVLALMNLSTFATPESKKLTDEYLKKERVFYSKELIQVTKRKYEGYESLRGLSEDEKIKLAKAYLEKAFFEEGNPPLKMTSPREEFEDHLALFRQFPNSSFIYEYFAPLSPVRQAELLFLMYSSSHANEESKKLLRNIYESQKKLKINALIKELQQKYQAKQGPSSYQNLTQEQKLKTLYSYQDRLFDKASTPHSLNFNGAQQKFLDYTSLLKKLGHVDKWRKFFASLKEEEAYEVLMLLKYSPYANAQSKEYTSRYLQDVKYYWQWNQYFIHFYQKVLGMFTRKKEALKS